MQKSQPDNSKKHFIEDIKTTKLQFGLDNAYSPNIGTIRKERISPIKKKSPLQTNKKFLESVCINLNHKLNQISLDSKGIFPDIKDSSIKDLQKELISSCSNSSQNSNKLSQSENKLNLIEDLTNKKNINYEEELLSKKVKISSSLPQLSTYNNKSNISFISSKDDKVDFRLFKDPIIGFRNMWGHYYQTDCIKDEDSDDSEVLHGESRAYEEIKRGNEYLNNKKDI